MKIRLQQLICLHLMILLWVPNILSAQAKYGREDVRSLFPKDIKNLWINSLNGTLDNKHRVDMIIGTDGQVCKGFYRMHTSGEIFFFEGVDKQNELKLVELTSENKASGFILGHYDGERFSGQWQNMDKTVSLTMELTFIPKSSVQHIESCIQDGWYRLYTGKLDDKPVKLLIAKDNSAYKIAYYVDSMMMVDIVPSKNKKSETIQPNFQLSSWGDKSILIDTSDLNQSKIVMVNGKDFVLKAILKSSDGLNFDCYEYADYYSRLVIQKPVSSNKKFNKWMESKMIDWMDDNISDLKKIKHDQIGTRDRWIQYAEGWVEIDLFTGDYISGTVYLQTSLKAGTKKISFIYDLRMGKELKLQDFFNKDFDSKDYFKHVLPAKKKEMTWKPVLKQWVDSQSFDYATLTDRGISFKTELSSIYGEKEILIPYREMYANLKFNSLIRELIKY